jgi:hypothetical protein
MNDKDFHARLKELYLPPANKFTLVDVPDIRFAVIDGAGNPESDAFADAIKWLFSVIHPIKPLVKERMGKNFVEPPLECLFWADDSESFISVDKDKWKWRVMIAVMPDWITQKIFDEAVAQVETKRGKAPESLRLENSHEGKSVQIMHIGDYGEIQSICHKMYGQFLPKNNLVPNGPYHEIYLNDPKRVAAKKRKIVLRQPVK